MVGPKRRERTDSMNAWMAMLGMGALLLLVVQSGCGSPSSASSNASVTTQPAKSVEPQSSTSAVNAAATTPAEVSSTEPATETPPVATSHADTTVSTAVSASPDNVTSEIPGSSVQPMAVALVQAEQVAEPGLKKSKPADTGSKKPIDPNRTYNHSFDDLKFDIAKGAPFERSMLPQKIEDYAGERVSIRGYIFPPPYQNGLTGFILVRDNQECCFGPGAAIYDCIQIQMAEGKTADYTIRPVVVEGKFSIDEVIGPDRKHLAIYKIVCEKVE